MEADQHAVLQLGDGSLVEVKELGGTGRCAACALEAAELLASGSVTASQAFLRSLARTETMRLSDVSGISLCPRHRRTIATPEGPIVMSTDEHAAFEKNERRKTLRRFFLSFIMHTDPRP